MPDRLQDDDDEAERVDGHDRRSLGVAEPLRAARSGRLHGQRDEP